MKKFVFGSVCSGIEAASVAFGPLDMHPAWLSEIEPFPSAVLAHHYPEVPNLGDMTAIADRVLAGEIYPPDLLCGGTPCQAFSVAGLRKSLDDARGNLSLVFCELANAIDQRRADLGLDPTIVFWENVPGVLTTKDNAFGCFLAGLAGEDDPIEPAGEKWTNAGVVLGPARAVAWRTLDAQYFGVAQRRRRVFVVASARAGFDPAEVLFEWDRLRRDTAPSREAGQATAGGAAAGAGGCGDISTYGTDGDGGGRSISVAPCLDTRAKDGPRRNQGGAIITMVHGQGGAEIGFDRGPTLTCNHEAPIAAYALQGNMIGRQEKAGPSGSSISAELCFTQTKMDVHCVAVAHSLRGEGFDASEDGTGRGTPLVPVAFDTTQITSRENRSNPQPGDPCHPLAAGAHPPAIAFPANLSGTQHATTEDLAPAMGATNPTAVAHVEFMPTMTAGGPSDTSHNQVSGQMRDAYMAPTTTMQVRRLTPTECERLQGFPDDYTAIPWRGKPASECPDGPRYKALGNSWAVPCVQWIGSRIRLEVLKGLA